MIAAHTDSPCLKLKPKFSSSKSGYLMVNVQTYGSGLWHTWFDRDLSLAGRVILRADDGSFSHKLVKINRPLLRVPTLAIHLNRYFDFFNFSLSFSLHLNPKSSILYSGLKMQWSLFSASKFILCVKSESQFRDLYSHTPIYCFWSCFWLVLGRLVTLSTWKLMVRTK